MSGSAHSGERVEPNLTPMLDMVFQLITFFMLLFNMKAADFDKNLNLPVVGSAAPAEEDPTVEFFVLNLRSGDKLFVQGREETNIEGYISLEGRFRTKQIESSGEGKKLTVVLRADRSLRSSFLMRVINSCKASGLDRFDFMVLAGGGQK